MASLPPEVFRRWVHAREEDEGDLLVFRPRGYPLPPARGRRGFELSADGGFVEYGIGRGDRAEPTHGSWRAQGAERALVSFPEAGRPGYTLEIVSAEPERLVVRRA